MVTHMRETSLAVDTDDQCSGTRQQKCDADNVWAINLASGCLVED